MPTIMDEQVSDHSDSLLTQIREKIAHLEQIAFVDLVEFKCQYPFPETTKDESVIDNFVV